MIRSLQLVGWKSHERTEIEFSSGTNVLIGIMGSGKSSVLQGITFGLFGEVPEVKTRKLGLFDLVMRKPRSLEEAKVAVEFDVGDVIYKVERTISKKGSEAEMFREGKVFESGARRVTEKVCEILSTDYEGFVNVVYARQNEIDNFLRYGKNDRVKLIDGLLRIDRLEEARKGLRGFHTGVKDRLADLKARAEKDVTIQTELFSGAEKQVEKLKGEMLDLQTIMSALKDQLNSRRLQFNKLESVRKAKEDVVSEMNRISGEENALNSRIERLPSIQNASKKFPGESERLSWLKSKLREAIEDLSETAGRRKSLESRINELRSLADVSKKEVKDFSGEIEKISAELSMKQAEVNSHISAIAQLKSAGAKCPVCESPLKNPSAHISRHESQAEELGKEISELAGKILALRKSQQESERARIEIEKAKALVKDLPGLESELRSIDDKIMSAEKAKLDREIAGQEKLVEELRLAVEREGSEKRLMEAGNRRQALSEKLKSLGFDESEYVKVRGEIEKFGSEYSGYSSRLEVLPRLIESKQSEMISLRREIDEVNKARSEKVRTEKNLESLSLLINSIADVQILVRRNFIDIVNELLGDVWVQLYPYGDYSSLRILVEEEGKGAGDYILQLRERKDWVNVDGVASGGEKSIASLALRVAFARALSKLGLLLLDEPTHNLDDTGVDKLSEVLREGMPSVLEQVLIITHEERMEKSATGMAYRLFRDKTKEEATSVEKL